MSSRGDNQYNSNFEPENHDSWLSLEIYLKSNHPELLNGLDRWLELGLISQMQVIKICRQNLSCALPEREAVVITQKTETISNLAIEQELVEVASSPSIISRVWQGFLDELSIRWLLFLGIFLVVISSGVLAASQWDNFPKFGQYLILLIYTLGFWGIGFWSSKQANLTLTSQTLRVIAILLVPINCWAISHFSLGNSILEWITLLVSLVALSIVVCWQPPLSKKYNSKFFTPLFILLSSLHLVWQFIPSPLLALYGSIFIISSIHYLFLLPKKPYPAFNLLFLISAWSLILIRVLLSEEYLILDCGLAIALLGWILATIYIVKEKQVKINSLDAPSDIEQLTDAFFSKVLQTISIILFIVTWSISVLGGLFNSPLFFWQTVGISVLTIHLFSQRLTLYWRKRDLTAIFLIGLQTVFVSKELIPDNIADNALNLAVTISKSEYLPESVFGVTLFPYLILFVAVASWLYRRQKSELANYAETLTFLLGVALTYLSLSNLTWRSLNFLFSTATLGYVAYIRQPIRIWLIYLTHLLGLITLVNGIDLIFPNLSQPVWGSILVLLMAGEWYIHSLETKNYQKPKYNFLSVAKETCWYAGLLLAAASYFCFASHIVDSRALKLITSAWGLIWLITPGMLTWVAKHTRRMQQRRIATSLSCIALIIPQLLILGHPVTRSIGLSMAIALMYFNGFHLRRTWVTVIHVAFGLGLLASLLDIVVSNENWLIVGAILILALYQFRQYLTEIIATPKFSYISQRTAFGVLGVGMETKNYKLIEKYIQAADYWAIALTAINLVILSIVYLDLDNFNRYPQYLLTSALILGAVIWRYQKQPHNLVLYTVGWLIELLAIGIVAFLGGRDLSFAVTNIILGLCAWSLMQPAVKNNSSWAKLNLASTPLIYTALAILWRLSLYNIYTGLITLSAAFILINTSQPNRKINLVTNYLGFIGISLGIYEIVIYQMQQSSGGSAADGLTILALVAAAIAFCYRLSAWWCRQRQHKTLFHLSLSRVILVAHIHWAISSILKIIAASIAIESTTPRLTPLSIATSFCLGAYAVIQGKDRDTPAASKQTNDWWVYVGLVEIIATLIYSRLIISKLSFFDPWRVIFTCAIACLIYQIPWQNLGWRVTPWQRAAVVTPALMALVTAEDISYFSLFVTALFYLRIAYGQKNLRWSYISLGFINWGIIRLVWQFNTELIWLAGIASLSVLYIAQFDPYFRSQPRQRHLLRVVGCSIICFVALFYQDPGIIPGVISFILIFIGLGLKIRALLFSGTVTLILSVIYQLITLVAAYGFLKWVVGLLVGIVSIIVAAGFEKNRDRLTNKLQNYNQKLQNWQ
ncbi:hypothetical protein I4641_05560 [Waterburya agarophytonicola K14]|uniref:DUF2157 domain-containing protein n=1 Tax=Waterburya agarophytonicola KI4 TaxID=2874699 RepID=A0A964FGC6_9CYAN|nr:hypothetical protein [Waterburya agarophytonicola]MCC0176444.1 hypothetical protein [Waterburya agarophytonicola KI4]